MIQILLKGGGGGNGCSVGPVTVVGFKNSIMAGLSASGLKTQIRSYTEVDSNVLSDSVLENIILNAQYRIFRDVPIDADRKQQSGNLVPGQETINCPAGAVFIRGIQVYDSSAVLTGSNTWLERKRRNLLTRISTDYRHICSTR